MVDRSGPELSAEFVGRGETKISDGHVKTVSLAKHVLWLQVAVVDAEVVAVLDRIEELEEHLLDQVVMTKVGAMVKDLGEEITLREVIEDDVGECLVLNDAVQ